MKTKMTIYILLIITSIIGIFCLYCVSFLMYFGKRNNIEIDTAIDNQLKINYGGFCILAILLIFSIYKIWKLKKQSPRLPL